jgi:glucose 1-dehydrogenase
MRFSNKVCLVTGAGSGIGKATAERMAAEGGKVLVIDRDEQGGSATAAGINSQGGEALFSLCDIGHEDEIIASVEKAVKKWNRVDVLVNNAAMMTFKKITDLTSAEWDQVMAINLRSVFLFCKYSIPHMNGGSIVNISSVHAHETTANVIPYASSKGAMEAFIRGVSMEYPAPKLRINCIAPGAIDTPMLRNNPNIKNGTEILEGAIGKPEEVAAAICFIASDEASFINGTTLIVDGGRLDIL